MCTTQKGFIYCIVKVLPSSRLAAINLKLSLSLSISLSFPSSSPYPSSLFLFLLPLLPPHSHLIGCYHYYYCILYYIIYDFILRCNLCMNHIKPCKQLTTIIMWLCECNLLKQPDIITNNYIIIVVSCLHKFYVIILVLTRKKKEMMRRERGEEKCIQLHYYRV